MLTKMFLNNKAYEVELLQSMEVIENIKKDFIGSDNCRDLEKTNSLNKVISQYIDNYEKVEYKSKEYFILKSRIPIEFKQKSYTKKFISGDSMFARVIGSVIFPVMFISTNIFDMFCNLKNRFNTNFGSTKINAKFRESEVVILSILLLSVNIGFYIWFINHVQNHTLPFWSIFIIQTINLMLGVLKPFSYHYNQIENYKLTTYAFDSKYENLSANPLEKLNAMKITPEQKKDNKKIDFDFSEEIPDKTKEKNHANY